MVSLIILGYYFETCSGSVCFGTDEKVPIGLVKLFQTFFIFEFLRLIAV